MLRFLSVHSGLSTIRLTKKIIKQYFQLAYNLEVLTTAYPKHQINRYIRFQFNNAETSLSSLVEQVPRLTKSCEDFARASSEIKVARRLNTLTLTRHTQLLQVLEIPQLMETCIREGHYEEALQLAAYVKRLASKHGEIPVVAVSRLLLFDFKLFYDVT